MITTNQPSAHIRNWLVYECWSQAQLKKVFVYQGEVLCPWSLKLKAYYQESYNNVVRLMNQQSALQKDIYLFKKELGSHKVIDQKHTRSLKKGRGM